MNRSIDQLYGEAPQLELPGLYNLSNVKSGTNPIITNSISKRRTNSVYGIAQFGFNRSLYIDVTGRNDWSSVLPTENNSYFYPSVNVSMILSDMLDLDDATWSYLKARGGWSRVGSDGATDPYVIQQTFGFRDETWGGVLLPFNPNSISNPNLRPEFTSGFEAGLEGKLYNNKLRFDATYYDSKVTDMIIDKQVSASSGIINLLDNVGEMQNRGIELGLGSTLVKRKNFSIDLDLNWSRNVNEVLSLGGDGEGAVVLGGQWNVDVQAREGLPFGVLFGPGFARDPNGNIIHENGLPVIDDEFKVLGDIQPDWLGGANLNVRVGGFNIGGVLAAKMGGEVYSMTSTWGRYAGVLEETLIGRETGIIGDGVINVGSDDEAEYIPNNIVVPAETYNKNAFSNDVAESSVFDASYVKLRQITVGYSLPKNLFGSKVFQNASVSLVGRNLAILWKRAPHIDPETSFGAESGLQGLEFGQLPSTRSVGINLNFNF